jgi:hypothetical protein
MKDLLKKVFGKKTVSPIFVGFGTFAIITFIVFPGLTAANTILNVLSAIVGIFTLVFVFYYLKMDDLYESFTNNIEGGETELDYFNPEELKPKKKRNPKQNFAGIDESEPFVKTRKKSQPKK